MSCVSVFFIEINENDNLVKKITIIIETRYNSLYTKDVIGEDDYMVVYIRFN
jgi:hypothetical protein